MKIIKAVLGSFCFQVAALCSVTALAVALRLLLLPIVGRAAISPFFSFIEFYVGPLTALPPVLFAAFFLTRRLYFRLPGGLKFAYGILAFFVFSLTINMALGSVDKVLPGALWQYCFDAKIIYSHGNFLRDYHVYVEGLHWHTTVHPPGVFVYLYPFLEIFPSNWLYIALANALFAGVGVFFVYKAAEKLYDGDVKYAAAALYVCTPGLLLYGSTIDAVMCGLGALVVYLLACYFTAPRFGLAAAIGLVLAIGVFVAYQFGFIWLLIITASFICASLIIRKRARASPGGAPGEPPAGDTAENRPPCYSVTAILAPLAVAAGVFCAFFIVLYLVSGFNVIEEFGYQQAASERYYGAGANLLYLIKRYIFGVPAYKGEHRSALFWIPGNFIAFMFLLGPTTSVLFLRNLYADVKSKNVKKAGPVLSLAAACSYVVINLSGLTLAETERVYLFMVPWFVLAAGYYLIEKKPRLLYAVLVFNLALSWLFVVFFEPIK